jgi:hypothetical protein
MSVLALTAHLWLSLSLCAGYQVVCGVVSARERSGGVPTHALRSGALPRGARHQSGSGGRRGLRLRLRCCRRHRRLEDWQIGVMAESLVLNCSSVKYSFLPVATVGALARTRTKNLVYCTGEFETRRRQGSKNALYNL